jgi:hypothetical protein
MSCNPASSYPGSPGKGSRGHPYRRRDAFIGSRVLSLLQGKTLVEAVEWGSYLAALSVTQKGTITTFPTPKEVEEFIKLHPR